ncbi:hypothetical protein [Pseudoalteromonas ruthenica]|uniref:hypothetical protein n=1 Tax=Pseudoalteromonas ruthenica TaxID=151081 RepID=UPI0006960D31|nr:hypothetical protein [Pseudoalteromonas ruthenica]TMO91045.1 hypothetical protein CWC13_17695 [Pseudoalteromonas ruthenica]TMO98494.1 hypothetical protein CWC07_10345 [Pseudoalteromonas ruthenica]TMP10079.1 hypothetical protein CWC08_08075 [Pseudoalteromonas ruthenica]
MHIVITKKEVVLTKQDYQSFREIQNDFFDYVTSLGPWSSEEIVDYLEIEYQNITPPAKEQVDALMKSEHFEVALKGLGE